MKLGTQCRKQENDRYEEENYSNYVKTVVGIGARATKILLSKTENWAAKKIKKQNPESWTLPKRNPD